MMGGFGKLVSLVDSFGKRASFSLHNAMRVASVERVAGGVFNDSLLDPNYTTTLVANGTVTVALGEAEIKTTTDSGSSAILTTGGLARYISTTPNFFRANLRFTNLGVANKLQAWGAVNDATKSDGYWFQLNGTTFEIVIAKNGTQTVIPSTAFTGIKNFAPTSSYATYEIFYTAREVQFVSNGNLIHFVEATDSALVAIRHLRPFVQNTNTGVGTASSIFSMNLTINSFGSIETQTLNLHIAGATTGILVKGGPGKLKLLVIGSSTNASVIKLYDALNATDATKAISLIDVNVSSPVIPVPFNWPFYTGLYVVVEGDATDISLSYD